MSDSIVYDVPIHEVVKILDKSDRQVRRYAKERRIKAKPVRVDGHIKLMFNRDEVMAFRDGNVRPDMDTVEDIKDDKVDNDAQVYVDAQLIDDIPEPDIQVTEGRIVDNTEFNESTAVKYVIDALKEQIHELRDENKELHYQLEQRSGLVGFWQGKAEVLQEEIKALAPVPKEASVETEELVETKAASKPFWRFWSRN
ncbi:MAG: hypothetical protein ACYC27_17255 [Armatimonadota bacterium]